MNNDLLKTISGILRDNVISAVCKVCSMLQRVVEYLERLHEDRKAEKKAKAVSDANDGIRKACDSGSLNDLLNAVHKRRMACAVFALFLLSGCSTIEIHTAKEWEGRYDSGKDAVLAAEKIRLDRGESVWVLSSETLKRILTTDKEQ